MKLKNKIEDAYAFEEGKTYMISVDTDESLIINAVRRELKKVNPKIRWIIVSSNIKPILNPEAQKLMDETLKNIIDEIDDISDIDCYIDFEKGELPLKNRKFIPEEKVKQIIQKHFNSPQMSVDKGGNFKCETQSPKKLTDSEDTSILNDFCEELKEELKERIGDSTYEVQEEDLDFIDKLKKKHGGKE